MVYSEARMQGDLTCFGEKGGTMPVQPVRLGEGGATRPASRHHRLVALSYAQDVQCSSSKVEEPFNKYQA